MKTEIENLFGLSSCEHDSYSSSAVCHFARVLAVLANGILRRAFDAGASSLIRVFPSRGL